MLNVLLKLFQLCFDSGKIPSQWQKSIINPIPKSKENDPRIPLNYRGISLMCCSAKLYSSLLNERIMHLLEEESSIVDEQNGFRKRRSCQDHIFVLDSIIRNRREEGLATYVAFIDLKKAFDCINRDFLLFKMLRMGIDGKMYNAVQSTYQSTKSCVRINNYMTSWFETLFGVRQGDGLSPTLFSIFINDLANYAILAYIFYR